MKRISSLAIVLLLSVLSSPHAYAAPDSANTPATEETKTLPSNPPTLDNISPDAIKELNDGTYTVSRIIDGDTLELDSGEKVRLIGVDTPESKRNRKLKKDVKNTGEDADAIIKMGKAAKEFTRSLVEGKQVRLEYDVQKQDNPIFDRTLAYVWYLKEVQKPTKTIDPRTGKPLMDPETGKPFMEGDYEDTMLNAELIKEGYAQAMTVPPNVKYAELFVKLEKEARENKRGFWK